MSAPYVLAIHPDAEREWGRLDENIRKRFKQKLAKERLIHPRGVKDALHGSTDLYKVQITTPPYRLACHVNDATRLLTIVATSSRDDVYDLLQGRV